MTARGVASDFPIPTQNFYKSSAASSISGSYGSRRLPSGIPESSATIGGKSRKSILSATNKPNAYVRKSVAASIKSPRVGFQSNLKVVNSKIQPASPPSRVSSPLPSDSIANNAEQVTNSDSTKILYDPLGVTSDALEQMGLGAVIEAQNAIEHLKAKVNELEYEIDRMQHELTLNAEELARRNSVIAEIQSSALISSQTAIPLDEARGLVSQVLKKGYALRILVLNIEMFLTSKSILRIGMYELARHAFGDSPWEYFLQRRTPLATATLAASPSPFHTVLETAQRTIKLLRTEQLFLLEENRKVSAEVQVLHSAMLQTPDKATEIFRKFSEIKAVPSPPSMLSGSQPYGLSRKKHFSWPLDSRPDLKKINSDININWIIGSVCVTAIDRLFRHKINISKVTGFFHWKQCIVSQNYIRKTRCVSIERGLRKLSIIIKYFIRHQMSYSFQRCIIWLHLKMLDNLANEHPTELCSFTSKTKKTSSLSLNGDQFKGGDTRSQSAATGKIRRIPRNVLESVAFVMRPEYYHRLPSVNQWLSQNHMRNIASYFSPVEHNWSPETNEV